MSLKEFVRESNKIEGILRAPTEEEIKAHKILINLPDSPSVSDLVKFVSVIQPDAVLRDKEGLNVYVGNHTPIAGGPVVRSLLLDLLFDMTNGLISPYILHCRYENIHPFTDGNGRSGRALWLRYMVSLGRVGIALNLGFLHTFYYQTLEEFQSTLAASPLLRSEASRLHQS